MNIKLLFVFGMSCIFALPALSQQVAGAKQLVVAPYDYSTKKDCDADVLKVSFLKFHPVQYYWENSRVNFNLVCVPNGNFFRRVGSLAIPAGIDSNHMPIQDGISDRNSDFSSLEACENSYEYSQLYNPDTGRLSIEGGGIQRECRRIPDGIKLMITVDFSK